MDDEICPGCGKEMVPQWDGGFEHWNECKNPDCDYEEEEEGS